MCPRHPLSRACHFHSPSLERSTDAAMPVMLTKPGSTVILVLAGGPGNAGQMSSGVGLPIDENASGAGVAVGVVEPGS